MTNAEVERGANATRDVDEPRGADGPDNAIVLQRLLVAIGLLVLAVINAILLPRALEVVIGGGAAVDWLQFVEAGDRVWSGDLYEQTADYGYRWSPILGVGFGVIGGMGTLAWRLLHVAAALALPTWPMRLMTLAAWPFWYDVEAGNVLVFVLLAAAWAIRGNRVGIIGFLVLTLLVPRPLMIPVAVWLLWKRPEWRLPFVGLAFVHLLAVLASGWADEWLRLLLMLGQEQASPNNLGPSRFIGAAWLVIGIPLAAFLTWRGRLGWASLAVSYPYVLPYYLIMLILELPAAFGLSRRAVRVT